MTKTYQLLSGTTLRTTIYVNGKEVSIRFAGGITKPDGSISRYGSLTTDDIKQQEAIENDSQYGHLFTCICKTSNKQHKEEVILDDFEKVTGITNTQSAIEWLHENKGYSSDGKPSASEVKSVATGYKVLFTDWK